MTSPITLFCKNNVKHVSYFTFPTIHDLGEIVLSPLKVGAPGGIRVGGVSPGFCAPKQLEMVVSLLGRPSAGSNQGSNLPQKVLRSKRGTLFKWVDKVGARGGIRVGGVSPGFCAPKQLI